MHRYIFASSSLTVALALFYVTALFSCSDPNLNPKNSDSRSVVWGGPKNISMLPIIAQKAGIFENHGLDAGYKYLQTGKITLDAVVRGEIQFGVIVEATMAFAAFERGLDVVLIAVNQGGGYGTIPQKVYGEESLRLYLSIGFYLFG
jgi:ABC-type nitrate/sulfonate/bicarbonate transport system substrate-binding protein